MAAPEGAKVSEAFKPSKEPPHETNEKIWRRRFIVLSFWGIAILLGLPIWWKTTTVYRASLPLDSMNQWANSQICSPAFPLRIGIDTSSLSQPNAQQLIREAQLVLDRSVRSPLHSFQLNQLDPKATDFSSALRVELRATRTASAPSTSIHPHTYIMQVSHSSSPKIDELAAYVATQVQDVFTEEKAIFSQLDSSSSNSGGFNRLSPAVAESVRRRTTRTFKYAPEYHLLFSLFTPDALPSSWDIEKALRNTFQPVLQAISAVSNFSIETQVQPYATFTSSLQPMFNEESKTWVVPREQLGGFINAAEWPLSPSTGKGPTINFALYVPSTSQSPMQVESSTSNSWLVPQWGVVSIYNPKRKPGVPNPVSLTEADLQPALLTFSNQLLTLLGFPITPADSLPLRLATLTRVHAASLFLSASSTLGALARLVSKLPSISIPDSVAENVQATLGHLDNTCTNFKNGDFHEALRNAREAEAHAEKAFFEKSMVGQVYFPDEHKVAVYLPLLGPVAVPLLVAGLAEIRPFVQRLRRRRG